jgi:predicted Zn-dependent peptidase
MRPRAFALALLACACGRIPPAQTAGVPPPWVAPAPPVPVAPAAVDAGPLPPAPPPPPSRDRTLVPPSASASPLTPPTPLRRKLKNGTPLLIVERHTLPIVTLQVVWPTGAADDPPGRAGLAGLTADLLDEGAGTRSAIELAEALAQLGAQLDVRCGWDATTVAATSLTKTLAPTLAIVADVVQRPSFVAAELERVKKERLTALTQSRDVAAQVAEDTLARVLYGERHRYGQPLGGADEQLAALTRADVVGWQRARLRPDTATVIVVGDVQPDELVRQLDAVLSGWTPPPKKTRAPLAHAAEAQPPSARKLVLVDRPEAAQTELRVGRPGVARTSPDYFPLVVMNAILGGNFSSRLNTNLREKHGYTYGARTDVGFRRGGGPLHAASPVKTAVTREAVSETLAELGRIRDAEVAPEELRMAKDLLERTMARTFETPPEVASAVATQVVYGLPDDYYATYAARIEAVTAADVLRVARAWIEPAKMPIVLVGDLRQIAAPMKELLGDYELRDVRGAPAAQR